MNDPLLMQKAYKKLKSSIYYDKTNLPLRDQIVSFEYDYGKDLNQYLDELYSAFQEGGEEWTELSQNIISSINCILLPKKLKSDEPSSKVITNFRSNSAVQIEKFQAFIDMNIEGHLMGMLWMLLIGWKLDKELSCCYGNRIRSKLRNELSEQITFSPYLFEPYFEKYESWRDTALQIAEEQLNKDEDILIITLDFEGFFYSVDITEEFMESIVRKVYDDNNSNENILSARINKLIYDIIARYSKKYQKIFPDERRGNILPIGFLPSNIISNWCLKPFDDALINGWNPLYYGRYVDDILIVEKVKKNSAIYIKANEGDISVDDIISFYLVNESRWKGFNCSRKGEALFQRNCKSTNENSNSDICYEYSVLPDIIYPLGDKANIKVQDTKAKIFYFRTGQSDALISCFRDNISKNKSEFRRMPEDDAVFIDDDYSEIYELEQSGINKIREVDGIVLDKYGLSKYLGKYQRVCGLVDDKKENKFVKDIQKIFNERTLIENYTFWEKVLTILFVNKYYSDFGNFINRITEAIDSVKIDDEVKADIMKESLLRFLISAINRVYSLSPRRDMSDEYNSLSNNTMLKEYFSAQKIYDIRKGFGDFAGKYFITRMADKSMCVLWPDMIIDAYHQNMNETLPKIQNVNCYSFDEVMNFIKNSYDLKESRNLPEFNYKYYPYLITTYDLSLAYQYWHMATGDILYRQDEFINYIHKTYVEKNYPSSSNAKPSSTIKIDFYENSEHPIIKVGNGNLKKVRIAVSSLKMDETNFTDLIKGKPNRKYYRYQQISYLMNTAIQQKADMLVMPEACVPIEWLATIARTCTRNDIAVITGVEHVILNDKVYNFTAVILPYKQDEHRGAHIIFHSKNHFAPDEIRQIEGYRLKAMDSEQLHHTSQYELYCWNNFWFSVYCCYELTSISERALFQSYVDAIVAVEWNHDVNYYSNILESLSRDLHCYCIQVNSCDYGDSRITKPSKTELKDVLRTKGGDEVSLLVGTIDIEALREFQVKEYELQREDRRFKATPPQFKKDITMKKIRQKL